MPTSSQPVALDLDALEREGDIPEPFRVTLGGRVYELTDPRERDFTDVMAAQQAIAAGQTLRALQLYVSAKDRDQFFANQLPGWKVDKLLEGYNKHFGLPSPGEAVASPTS